MAALTVHVIAPFHSRLLKEKWSHCAFTQITLKQIEIFRQLDEKPASVHVIDYSNYGSESAAHERVMVLPKAPFEGFFCDDGMPGHRAEIGSVGHSAWKKLLEVQVAKRVTRPGRHVFVHTFGDAAASLVSLYPQHQHVESHVGYDRPPFGAQRVYVSEAWRHFMWGKYPSEVGDRRYSWVVLPYYNAHDWPLVTKPQDYIAFMGRIVADKGMSTIKAIAQARPRWQFKIAGAGAGAGDLPPNVKVVGLLPGKKRAAFVGNARVLLCPTEYVEPCAGVVCEAAMTGTPTVASSWGGFMESIERGATGYHAATLAEWIACIEAAKALDRRYIASEARRRFSLDAAAEQYRRIFVQLLSLGNDGWYAGVKSAQPNQSPV